MIEAHACGRRDQVCYRWSLIRGAFLSPCPEEGKSPRQNKTTLTVLYCMFPLIMDADVNSDCIFEPVVCESCGREVAVCYSECIRPLSTRRRRPRVTLGLEKTRLYLGSRCLRHAL